MNKKRFEHEMRKARALSTNQTQDYWAGYQRGLRRNFYGKNFGTEAEHQSWLTADGGENWRQHSAGYRAGLAVD